MGSNDAICPNGHRNPFGATECDKCGEMIQTGPTVTIQSQKCSQCGASYPQGFMTCPDCGFHADGGKPPSTPSTPSGVVLFRCPVDQNEGPLEDFLPECRYCGTRLNKCEKDPAHGLHKADDGCPLCVPNAHAVLKIHKDSAATTNLDVRQWYLVNDIWVIGKSGDFGPPLLGLSREHCEVRWQSEKHWILDEKSKNGTFVDGTQIEQGKPFELPKKCILRFGKDEAEFEFESLV